MPSATFKGRYRVSERPTEILEAIDSGRLTGRNFIWFLNDDTSDEQRTTFPIQITDLRVVNETTLIVIENKSETFRLNQAVYIRMHSRDAAFKTRVVDLNDLEVYLEFPKEIVINDLRKIARTPFSVLDHKIIKTPAAEFLCLDVHKEGMALFLKTDEIRDHAIDHTLTLIALGDEALPEPIIGTIVSKTPYQARNEVGVIPGFRLGIELAKPLPDSILGSFSLRKSLYELHEERLVRDTIFRKKVHEQMQDTINRLSQHRQLKKFFAHLNFERKDNDYIKIHIRLLCEILCGLGTRLGWVSEKTMDKLVYIAFMHDVALLNSPEIAKIKSKRQLEIMLEQNPNTLTLDEVKQFYDAPAHSAELARLDPDSYPDTVRILLQQKELPDGSGFPHSLNGSQLIPLSCLFIFSHYLVDYMYNDPDWSIEEFIKTHQWILKGTYFTKIIQLLS